MYDQENSDERKFHQGVNGPYHWLTVTGGVHMATLLHLCPEAVSNRFLAVTSLDSGIRELAEEEADAGWQLTGDVAYSPLVTSVGTLRFQRDGLEFPGYDEWYVFDARPSKLGQVFHGNPFEFQAGNGEILVFVNMFAFALHDDDPGMQGIVDIFWNQLKTFEAETFIADGRDCLTLLSKSWSLIDRFQERLVNSSAPSA
jgi:hypothetical protein